MCDWIEAHGERYEGFVEDEGEESDGGRGKRRGKGGKDRDAPGSDAATTGPSKRLQAYLRGMRENGEYLFLYCGVDLGACDLLSAHEGSYMLSIYVNSYSGPHFARQILMTFFFVKQRMADIWNCRHSRT